MTISDTAELLANGEYIRERVSPRPGDPFYLHLSDLLIALKSLVRSDYRKVLDYGCGGSPYRSLFGSCTYHRADLDGGFDLDYSYGPSAKLPSHAGAYDCVLSTQVLEHVVSPDDYLREAWRALRSEGHLILTTHGLYRDHGCPHDFWRWTVYGLMRVLENSGFRVEQIRKLTTGPRGAVFLAEQESKGMYFSKDSAYGSLLWLGTRALRVLGSKRRHLACDEDFAGNRVVGLDEPCHDLYIAIAVLASRCD